jgi:ADP-heptose:LPS heptosyltransferase
MENIVETVQARGQNPVSAGSSIRRIAVLRALYLGDLVVSIPAFRSLRAGFPDAEITLIALPWARHLVRNLGGYLDRFVPFVGYPGMNDVQADPDRVERFVAEQRSYTYDLVIQMHGAGRQSNPCAHDLGGRLTAGYYLGERPTYLDMAAPYPEHLPEALRCLELAKLLGCPERGPQLEFSIRPTDTWLARRLLAPLSGSGPLIGIHPGAKSPTRRWPAEDFAALADTLSKRLGARIVLTGMPDEEAAAAVKECMTESVLDLSGRSSLGTLAAVLDALDLLIVNNTGPAHLAEAVGTPTVRIWDLDEPGRWEPLDTSRHRLVRGTPDDIPRPDGRWWSWPGVGDVLAQVDHLLGVGAAA